MTKLAFSLKLLNRIRTEKNPPLLRYCCLLALAETPDKAIPQSEIFRRFGGPTTNGTLPSAVRAGLVQEFPGRNGQTTRYKLTPAGCQLVQDLLCHPTSATPAS